MLTRFTAALIAAAFACTPTLHAQTYPGKPVHIIVGYATGGAADAGLRPLARAIEPLLGQPIIIEYKPGAAGGVAMEFIAKAPTDGYTLYYADNGPLTIAPHVNKVTYDSLKSFTHLGHVCGSGSMLVVHAATPFTSMAEVIAISKREPDRWSYGTSGVGGPHHLSGEYFKNVTGARLLHVPYKGGGPAGLAQDAVARIAQVLQKSKEDKQMRDALNATGCDAEILTPAQTVEKIRADYAKWGKLVKEANIRAE